MPKSPAWKWLETSEYGGQDGSVLTKLFKGKENLTAEELLAREVIQNSWDAARVQQAEHGTDHFEVVFRFVELRNAAKAEFVKAACLDGLRDRRSLVPAGSGLEDEQALTDLVDPAAPLRLLYLEDYGSHGLFGDPEKLKSKSHLFKAMYLVGGTGKTDESAAQGGSYGFGKSAFVRASGTNTVLAHSAFGVLDDDPVTRRLVGWTWWPGHSYGDKDYEGRAILGNEVNGHVVPFTDDVADEFAAELGMRLRDPSDLDQRGTTFLLLDPVVQPEALCHAIEVHWWPALEEHLMDVRVIDYKGNELIPRPSKVDWLGPYLEAFRIASGSSPVVDEARQRRPSDNWRAVRGEGVGPGEMGLVTTDVEMPEDMAGPRVALIRSPRMVIEYKPFLRRTMPIYGAYIASGEADPFLRLTEPPAHDLWETKQRNDTPKEATKIAKSVLDRVKSAVAAYADEFQPPPPQEGQRLNLMAKLLSSFVKNKPVIPPPSNEPISIQFIEPEEAVAVAENRIRVQASIRVAVTEAFGGEGMRIAVSCPVVISEDDAGHGERWPSRLTMRTSDKDFDVDGKGAWVGFLKKGTPLEFDLETDPFDGEWTAIVHPMVERLETVAVHA